MRVKYVQVQRVNIKWDLHQFDCTRSPWRRAAKSFFLFNSLREWQRRRIGRFLIDLITVTDLYAMQAMNLLASRYIYSCARLASPMATMWRPTMVNDLCVPRCKSVNWKMSKVWNGISRFSLHFSLFKLVSPPTMNLTASTLPLYSLQSYTILASVLSLCVCVNFIQYSRESGKWRSMNVDAVAKLEAAVKLSPFRRQSNQFNRK